MKVSVPADQPALSNIADINPSKTHSIRSEDGKESDFCFITGKAGPRGDRGGHAQGADAAALVSCPRAVLRQCQQLPDCFLLVQASLSSRPRVAV